MSVYGGLLSEQTMRRPFRFFWETRRADLEQTPQRRHRSREPLHTVLHRRHMNPISVADLNDFVESVNPQRSVLGVAVVGASDMTAEERADAATYFEAVGPDGAAWMEELILKAAPASMKAGSAVTSKTPIKTRQTSDCTAHTSTTADDWLTSRSSSSLDQAASACVDESSQQTRKNDGAQITSTAEVAWPAFASCGAGKVARSRKRKQSRVTLHDAAAHPAEQTDAGNLMCRPRNSHTHGSTLQRSTSTRAHAELRNRSAHLDRGTASSVDSTRVLHASRTTASAPAERSKKRSGTANKESDEATIVFTDICVASLPDSVVTAFAGAFQPEQCGVVVNAVLPRRTRQHGARAAAVDQARGHLQSSVTLSSIAAHALSIVTAAAQGHAQSTLDRAVVLKADAADNEVQQYAYEAKNCQRPRFRRRTSLEVYGRSVYEKAK